MRTYVMLSTIKIKKKDYVEITLIFIIKIFVNLIFYIFMFKIFIYVCICMCVCLCKMYKHVCIYSQSYTYRSIFDIFNTDCLKF